jgi:flagellar protein FlaG
MDVTANNMDVKNITPSPIVAKTPESNPASPSEKAVKPAQISRQDIDEMVDALKDLTETLQTTLNFSVDEGTNNIVVKIIEKDTDKVIRQIPPEELLDLQEKMQDLTGFLLSKEV